MGRQFEEHKPNSSDAWVSSVGVSRVEAARASSISLLESASALRIEHLRSVLIIGVSRKPELAVLSHLFPEPVCNANQEFVPAIELLEHGFPVSCPSGVEPVGDLDSATALDFGPDFVENYTTLAKNGVDFAEIGANLTPCASLC